MADDNTQAVGPGTLISDQISPKPLLEGASEFEYVEILNPLSMDFVGQFGVTRPIRAEVTISPTVDGQRLNESQAAQQYGIPRLTNPAKSGNMQITNQVRIPSGKTVRLLGNEAQVITKQLVNEIMQREGKRLQLADAFQRRQVEERIIIARGNLNDILGRDPVSVSDQLRAALKPTDLQSSEEKIDEPVIEVEFPSLQQGVGQQPAEPGQATPGATSGSDHPGTAAAVSDQPEPAPQRRKRRTKAQMAKARAAHQKRNPAAASEATSSTSS